MTDSQCVSVGVKSFAHSPVNLSFWKALLFCLMLQLERNCKNCPKLRKRAPFTIIFQFGCHNMFASLHTSIGITISLAWSNYNIFLHFSLQIHLCLYFIFLWPSQLYFSGLSVPTWISECCLNQLNKALGNEKNKSSMAEDFSVFQFPALYLEASVISGQLLPCLFKKIWTILPSQNEISEWSVMACK